MSSAYKRIALTTILLAATFSFASTPPLRVCSDPNNLPFSNMRGQGFENALARMVGADLHRQIEFVWWPQRAEFQERWLKKNMCDMVMATAASSDLLTATRPYYRSTYVFVSRRDRNIHVASITDASLKDYRIGAQLIGDDDAEVPPAQELARLGLVRNLVGYSLYGHPFNENPGSEIISATEHGDVDVAVAWAPLAAYFAARSPVPLQLTPICPLRGGIPFSFDISMAVRHGDDSLLRQLNQFIARRQTVIRALLRKYNVPILEETDAPANCH
jgi:mxaJ protein